MNAREAETVLVEELRRIAPDIDITVIDRDGDLREQFDIDSMDFLNLVIGLHQRTGVDIPEADYPRLFTLAGMAEYFGAH